MSKAKRAAKHQKKQVYGTANDPVELSLGDAEKLELALESVSNKLVFALNGEKVEIAAKDVDPTISLNDYLRRSTPLSGAKLGCGEGGCGACVVSLSRYDISIKKVVHLAVNSCLRPLASCDGWAITTVEGLGGSEHKNGFHPVQERLAKFHGSQCGFCTPGFVMAMYTSIRGAEVRGDQLTMSEVEQNLDGNICRCTGYRPILDACKSLCKDSDIEDYIGGQKFSNEVKYNHSPFPEFLKAHLPGRLRFQGSGVAWARPSSLAEVFTLLGQVRAPGEVRLVVAGTSLGIYKHDTAKVLVDIQNIPELNAVSIDKAGVSVGASVSLSRFIDTLQSAEALARARGDTHTVAVYTPLVRHVLRIASKNVRDVGSVAGNVVLAKTRGFLSDLATILLAANASLTLATHRGTTTQTMVQFLSTPTFEEGQIVQSVFVPATKQGDVFNTYKAALRPTNSHAFINAGFLFNIAAGKITSAVAAFGGAGKEDSRAVRATQLEQFLVGKPVSRDTLKQALGVLKKEVSTERHRAAYRASLVTGFFYKFFLSFAGDVEDRMASAVETELLKRPLGHNKQSYKFTKEHFPVSEPVSKLGIDLQTSGEAKYIDDFRMEEGTVFAAYVYSTEALAKLVSVDTAAAQQAHGFIAFLTAKDIPGKNNASAAGGNDPLFADGEVTWAGQAIGLVLADTTRHAEAAAALVKVKYDTTGLKPVITIKQAREQKTEMPGIENEYVRGKPDETLAQAKKKAKGRVACKTQSHFALEPHVAHAVPDEEGTIHVTNAMQWPDAVHRACAAVTGLPLGKIDVKMRRAGGGFGGKIINNIKHACAVAVAARVLKRPIHMVLNRTVDTIMSGGRHEVESEYEVAYDEQGVISGFTNLGYLNAGVSGALTWFVNNAFALSLDQAYYIPNYRSKARAVRSNLPGRTAMRGPGEVQSSFVIESVMDHVAWLSGVAPHVVRERNMYSEDPAKKDLLVSPKGSPLSNYNIPTLWNILKQRVQLEERLDKAHKFNQHNRWKKRGCAMTPVRYEVGIWAQQALVNVYSDGSVVITQTGCEIGQGLYTKIAQMASYALGRALGEKVHVPLSFIRFADTNTAVTPNAMFTGGSTGSEGSAEATRLACEEVVTRLKPIVQQLEAKRAEAKAKTPSDPVKDISWPELCGAANGASANLSAVGKWAGAGTQSLSYHNYGVAFSEVEIDVLTGESTVLETSMVYDAGKSLNPAIDIGQAEGAFIMGLGFYTREDALFDESGRLLSVGTWEYKPPVVKDIPVTFNVDLHQDSRFEKGILSSKASGEPPLVLAASVGSAIRQAILSARKDAGKENEWVELDTPFTVEKIQQACGFNDGDFVLAEDEHKDDGKKD